MDGVYTCCCGCGCRWETSATYCGACAAGVCPGRCGRCQAIDCLDDDGLCDRCEPELHLCARWCNTAVAYMGAVCDKCECWSMGEWHINNPKLLHKIRKFEDAPEQEELRLWDEVSDTRL